MTSTYVKSGKEASKAILMTRTSQPTHQDSDLVTAEGTSHQQHTGLEKDAEQAGGQQAGERQVDDTRARNYAVQYTTGWRFASLITSIYSGIFLAQLELTVVVTALVAIAEDLDDFGRSSWIVNAYLVTWSGSLILWAQFSRSIGKKACFCTALLAFILFSAGCAAAETMNQLIVLRAWQGIGAAGVYSIGYVISADAVRPSSWPKYTAVLSAVSAVAYAAGPLIGGAIASHTSWRWVFILNVPTALLSTAIAAVAIPNGFPFQGEPKVIQKTYGLRNLKGLDYLGALLLLGITFPFVTSLEEVNVAYTWQSATVIALLVVSGICLVGFTSWEYAIFRREMPLNPILSWRFTQRRTLGLLMYVYWAESTFTMGVPFICGLVIITQRFQVVNGLRAMDTGIRLIAYIVAVSLGTYVGTLLVGKVRVPPATMFIAGSLLQLAAALCFALVNPGQVDNMNVPAHQYGFQLLLGAGIGMCIGASIMCIPGILQEEKGLISQLMGVVVQIRFAGAAFFLPFRRYLVV